MISNGSIKDVMGVWYPLSELISIYITPMYTNNEETEYWEIHADLTDERTVCIERNFETRKKAHEYLLEMIKDMYKIFLNVELEKLGQPSSGFFAVFP